METRYNSPAYHIPGKKNVSGFSMRKCYNTTYLGDSKDSDGVFCVHVIVTVEHSAAHVTEAAYLICEQFRDWKKLHHKMQSHPITNYHNNSAQNMELVMEIQKGSSGQRSTSECLTSDHPNLDEKEQRCFKRFIFMHSCAYV